jgi:hypothetical protein
MESCRFCARPRRHGSVMCGTEECRKAYYREWHRENRKRHPERYGSAFYRARGQTRPKRPPASEASGKRAANIGARSAERLARLAEWICGRWYGATKAQLVEAFEEFYDVCALHSSSERRYYRDMAKLRADGFVWICGRMVRADRAHALTDAA